MNKQKWKDLISKRSTIWAASLCLVGAIVLGGIASVNSSRDDTDRTSDTQTGQLAYLEEDLDPDASGEGLSADDSISLEEVSGNTIENSDNTSGADSASGDNASDTDSASDDATTDAAVTSGDNISDDGTSDATSVSDGSVSGEASTSGDSASDGSASDVTSASGSDASDTESTTSDDASNADSAAETAEEASSSGIISEAALIEAGISFTEEQSILWPSAGTVIIDYSMDKSVYFATLNQYKYNPALIISSATGNQVLASAKGIVESITIDEETGTTLVLNIGNGYKLTYGQLMEPAVSEGDIVEAGDLLAYISEPTKYYCTEGSNLYFAMTKDGEPVDPVLYLE